MLSHERIQEIKKALGHGAIGLVAKETGYSSAHVSRVLSGERSCAKIETAIAKRLAKFYAKQSSAA